MTEFSIKAVDLPSKDCADGIAVTQDGRVAIVNRFGGIPLYSAGGRVETILPGVEKIRGAEFLRHDRLALLFWDNTVRLYDHDHNTFVNKAGVVFKTLSLEEGGMSVLAADKHGKIYLGYNDNIHVFPVGGGRPERQVPCRGFTPKQMAVLESGDILVVDVRHRPGGDGVVDRSAVLVIDLEGRQTWSRERKGFYAQAAVSRDGSVLVSWLREGPAEGRGLLTVEKHHPQRGDYETLVIDMEVATSVNPAYFLQEFATGDLAFCTADKLYIIHLKVDSNHNLGGAYMS